jgi:hypothetical protein
MDYYGKDCLFFFNYTCLFVQFSKGLFIPLHSSCSAFSFPNFFTLAGITQEKSSCSKFRHHKKLLFRLKNKADAFTSLYSNYIIVIAEAVIFGQV